MEPSLWSVVFSASDSAASPFSSLVSFFFTTLAFFLPELGADLAGAFGARLINPPVAPEFSLISDHMHNYLTTCITYIY